MQATNKPETLPEQLARIAREHCVDCTIDCTGAVILQLHWSKPGTTERGIDLVPVRTMRQLKIALGY